MNQRYHADVHSRKHKAIAFLTSVMDETCSDYWYATLLTVALVHGAAHPLPSRHKALCTFGKDNANHGKCIGKFLIAHSVGIRFAERRLPRKLSLF